MVLMTPVWGYASATNSMVSNLIGQLKHREVFGLINKIVLMSALTVLSILLINLIHFKFLLRIMTSDEQLISDALPSYIVIWLGMFFFSISMVLLSAVSGTGKTNVALFIEFFNILIYVIYAYFTTQVLNTSLHVVWYAEVIYWIIMGVSSWLYLRSKKWITSG